MLLKIAPWIWYISLSSEVQVKPPVTVSSGCSSQSSAPPLTLTVSVPQPLHKICKQTEASWAKNYPSKKKDKNLEKKGIQDENQSMIKKIK